MIRRSLERLSRGLVLRRRLPRRFGGQRVFVSPEAALQYWRWDFDKGFSDLFQFVEEFVKPGNSVWDIGANMGIFTYAAAHRSGPSGTVISVEPDAFAVQLLRRSAAERCVQRATINILPVAVSDSIGLAEFCIVERGTSMNHLACSVGSSQTGGTRCTVTVPTLTLDWLLDRFSPPQVIKIDVEGAELAVLRGAKRMLSDVRPVMLCEVWETNAEECSKLWSSASYELYDFQRRDNVSLSRAVYNTLAIPR
jgi:FkbM family methyltransferase